MGEAQHTPGPWAFDPDGALNGEHAIQEDVQGGGKWKAVATVHKGRLGGGSGDVQPTEAEANARLIAAAPLMLSMIRDVLPLVQLLDAKMNSPTETQQAIWAIQTIIAKATGD